MIYQESLPSSLVFLLTDSKQLFFCEQHVVLPYITQVYNLQSITCREHLYRLLVSIYFSKCPASQIPNASAVSNSQLGFFSSTERQHCALGNCSQAGVIVGFILWVCLLLGITMPISRTKNFATYILLIFITAVIGRPIILPYAPPPFKNQTLFSKNQTLFIAKE